LLSKGLSVISFDLVSDNKFVVEADICERIPLPGSEGGLSEKSAGEGQIVDVVVCALSLMGTNWVNCLREAWRVLKAGQVFERNIPAMILTSDHTSGQLHIAEVTSRFTNVEDFISLVGSIGFHLKSRVSSHLSDT
jgi:ribosomal RNA-processing protein 8